MAWVPKLIFSFAWNCGHVDPKIHAARHGQKGASEWLWTVLSPQYQIPVQKPGFHIYSCWEPISKVFSIGLMGSASSQVKDDVWWPWVASMGKLFLHHIIIDFVCCVDISENQFYGKWLLVRTVVFKTLYPPMQGNLFEIRKPFPFVLPKPDPLDIWQLHIATSWISIQAVATLFRPVPSKRYPVPRVVTSHM